MANWNYSCGDGGPHTWLIDFPAAAGKKQSPIDIQEKTAMFDPSLADNPIKIQWKPNCVKCITNTGHNWMATVNGQDCTLSGGPLCNVYQLEQFHVHWGSDDHKGSEHTINGKSYAAELHIVHWNKDKFPSFGEAAKNLNGLSVLGIFMQLGAENKTLKALTEYMCNIQYKSQSEDVKEFNLISLLPGNIKEYWTYTGSLTTPPCYESVTWIVFKEPITVSLQQMEAMRNLLCYCKGETPSAGSSGKLVDNYRPTYPLGDRKLIKSFQ